MRRVAVQQIDAFTSEAFFGNPAGVVTDASGLSPSEMQLVARELNCSETAFVLPSDQAEMRIRYFTPAVEVDLCGHATIATLHALNREGRVHGSVLAETNAGLLRLEVRHDKTCWMEQAKPAFRPFEGAAGEVAHLLGLEPADIDPSLPIGVAYTGLWDLLVPVRSLEALRRASPDARELGEHNRSIGVVSTHLFCRETVLEGSTLHTRDFSPAAGVPEDPHTGTASGALCAYLVKIGALAPGTHVFEQGWTVARPGLIFVEVAAEALGVRVGGHAVEIMRGELLLPTDQIGGAASPL